MANIVQTEATNFLAASLGKAAFTAVTTQVNMKLGTNTPTATGAMTEVANAGGSTYAAQPLTSALGTVSAGAVTNTSAVTFTNMPASTTVTSMEVWDTNGTPNRRWYGTLQAPKTTALGDTLSFAASSINISAS